MAPPPAYADPGMAGTTEPGIVPRDGTRRRGRLVQTDLARTTTAYATASDPLGPPLSPPLSRVEPIPAAPSVATEPPAEPVPVTVPAAAHTSPAAVARPRRRVAVRLTTGELIEVAEHEDDAAARAEATALMRYLRDGRGDWPFLAGRYVRPETIVSIDVDDAPA
jgi:hypothetical protein